MCARGKIYSPFLFCNSRGELEHQDTRDYKIYFFVFFFNFFFGSQRNPPA